MCTRGRPLLAIAVLMGLFVSAAACSAQPSASGAAEAAGTTTTDKVTVTGDSISVGLGAALRTAVGDDVVVKVIGEEGSGFARPDVFDWPGRLVELARDFPPTVLVLSAGSNDAQDLTDASGSVVVPFADGAAWDAEYGRRLAAAFDAFAATDSVVVWVGHVRTSDPTVAETNRRIHQLAVQEAASRDWVVTADLAALLGAGEEVPERCLMPDGLHVTVGCLEEAAAALAPQLPLD